MCIERVPSNSYNFIQWHAATGLDTTGLASPIDYCSADPVYLPNTIWQYERRSFPVIIDGKTVSFYANLTTAISDADFANWRLSVYDMFGNETVSDVATLVKDEYADSSYRFYVASFTVDSISKGRYRFVIYNTSTEAVKYVSNCFDYRLEADITDYGYFDYRHSSTLYGFNYATLTSFRNKIFLKVNDIEDQPELEIDNYPAVTTGEVRTSKTYAKEVRTLETSYFDREAQRGMLALSAHDDIKINTKEYTVKEAYQTIASRGNSLKKGTISFYDDEVSTINLSGYDV